MIITVKRKFSEMIGILLTNGSRPFPICIDSVVVYNRTSLELNVSAINIDLI